MIYSRLLKMKELSRQMGVAPARHESLNPLAVELGLQKAGAADFNEADRYSDLFRTLVLFVSGDVEAGEFEDSARTMYGTSAYLVFTLDKLAQAAIKVLQQIASDPKSMELLTLYYKDRAKQATSSRQEAVYRLSAEALTQEENTFRLEWVGAGVVMCALVPSPWRGRLLMRPRGLAQLTHRAHTHPPTHSQFTQEKTLTLQVLRQEDYILDDYISSEEKWSLYVDHFVQLSKESAVLKRKEPFLSRNLPKDIGEELPKNVFTHSGTGGGAWVRGRLGTHIGLLLLHACYLIQSPPPSPLPPLHHPSSTAPPRPGLELKICVNTYKIFFVDGTEDFFFRKRRATASPAAYVPRRALAALLADPERGWAAGVAEPGAAAARVEAAFVGGPPGSKGQLTPHPRPGHRVFWRAAA
jgi:paired amphipathic helix protein Sin3a